MLIYINIRITYTHPYTYICLYIHISCEGCAMGGNTSHPNHLHICVSILMYINTRITYTYPYTYTSRVKDALWEVTRHTYITAMSVLIYRCIYTHISHIYIYHRFHWKWYNPNIISTISTNSNSTVQIQLKPESPFEFVARDTEECEFLDLLDFGGVVIPVETVISHRESATGGGTSHLHHRHVCIDMLMNIYMHFTCTHIYHMVEVPCEETCQTYITAMSVLICWCMYTCISHTHTSQITHVFHIYTHHRFHIYVYKYIWIYICEATCRTCIISMSVWT